MNVLMVNTHLDPETGGGYLRRTLELARALQGLGNRVTLLATDHAFGDRARRETSAFQVVTLPTFSARFFVPKCSRSKIEKLVSEADVIHLMGFWSLLNVLVAREAFRKGVPFFVSPAGALPAVGRSRFLKASFFKIFSRDLVVRASRIFAITSKEASDMAKAGVPESKLRVLPNGVPPEFFNSADAEEFRRKHGLEDAPYLLFVGRLNDIKGPDLLVEAFLKTDLAEKGYRLVLAGPDEGMRAALDASARARDVGLVFTGYIDFEEKRSAYAGCEFLVIPSRYEAMSLVALEAAASGRAVLLTDRCGFDEVESCGGGFVVASNSDAISEGLIRMVALGREGLDEKGRILKELVRTNYTWPSVAGAFIEESEHARGNI